MESIKKIIERKLCRQVLKLLSVPQIRKKIYEVTDRSYEEREAMNIRFELSKIACKESAEYVNCHMLEVSSVDSRNALLSISLSHVEVVDGLYLEFGVAAGDSINFIANKIKNKIHGFDSFQGLPEGWIDGLEQGTFSSNGVAPVVQDNVELHIGWFEESLPKFVDKHDGAISFLHIDSDLYSSGKTIFDTLGNQIVVGTVIQFDEYFNYPGWKLHEYKAFQEFVTARGIQYEYIGYNRLGYSVAVKITGL